MGGFWVSENVLVLKLKVEYMSDHFIYFARNILKEKRHMIIYYRISSTKRGNISPDFSHFCALQIS